MENKENQEGAAASISVASPRVSSVGAASEGGDHPQQHPQPQGYTPTPYRDHLHWGGVQRMLHARSDARSVASSAAADRDDKSIYAEDVGALDAHTGARGATLARRCAPLQGLNRPAPLSSAEGDERDEDDEEEPEELTLTQVRAAVAAAAVAAAPPPLAPAAVNAINAGFRLAQPLRMLSSLEQGTGPPTVLPPATLTALAGAGRAA